MASSFKERVRLHGLLTGQGHEAECTVLAIKVTLRPSGPSAYARYSVQSVTKSLPEGDYKLVVSNGETIPVRYCDGHWLSHGLS
jgi:hypothetical protein